MIRFVTISLTTLGVLAVLFFVLVWHAQPASSNAAIALTPIKPTQVAAVQGPGNVGPGQKPWAENFEDGKLTSKFTASQFTPQKDGSYLVDHPISIFFLDKGQWMRVTGDTGVVNCDSAAPGGNKTMFAGPTASPRNGSLHHVFVEMFPTADATRATQWMQTENIHFDNETLRMYTESFVDDQGKTVLADEVPVTVRGDEYEFDGTGLTLIWDVNKHLEKLEVAHGKRLEIKNPSKLALPGMPAAQPVKQVISADPVEGMLASTDRSAVGLAPAPARTSVPAKPAQPQLPYRALFHHQVRITQGDRLMAVGDLMTIDFLQGAGGPKPAVTAGATVTPLPVIPAQPAPVSAQTSPVSTAAPVVSTLPSTNPSKGPVTIYWTGRLLVTPLKTTPMMPIVAGQSVVRLVGSPVRLTPEGSEITAGSATYRNPDGKVSLISSADYPKVEVVQTKGLTLTTGAINYDPATAIATMSGPGDLNVPVDKTKMQVSWSKQGLLHVIRVPGQPNGVDRIDLTDDVAVTHPEFTLFSRELILNLDLIPKPGAAATDSDEQLRVLTAIDKVNCRLIHPGKPTQGIDSDKLVIHTERTADKRTVPREVIADGQVHAFDPDQSIKAEHLDAMLVERTKAAPAMQGSSEDVSQAVDLDSLLATTSVHALMKNGATAFAEQLKVTTVNGRQFVELRGPNGAILTDGKGSRLTGPIVHLVPDRSGVSVDGPGTMRTIRRVSSTRPTNTKATPPQPIDVSWTDSMKMDGAANIADVYGQVTVKNIDAAGTASTITGDKAHLDLVDTPKNTQKTAAASPDAMGGKQLKKLTLTGNVVGLSELDDTSGAAVRRGNLYGNQLIYTAADGNAVIPGPGKLFVENHKPDTGNANDTAGSRGAMAIEWDKQLAYNQNTQKITIDGNTRVGFEQEPKAGKPVTLQVPMQLISEQLILTLSKAAPNAPPDQQGKMQLTRMQSSGQVRFAAHGIDLACGTMDYDPKTSIMTLTGTPDQPGRAMDDKQDITGTFDQLHYNTATEEVIDSRNLHGTVRR